MYTQRYNLPTTHILNIIIIVSVLYTYMPVLPHHPCHVAKFIAMATVVNE